MPEESSGIHEREILRVLELSVGRATALEILPRFKSVEQAIAWANVVKGRKRIDSDCPVTDDQRKAVEEYWKQKGFKPEFTPLPNGKFAVSWRRR